MNAVCVSAGPAWTSQQGREAEPTVAVFSLAQRCTEHMQAQKHAEIDIITYNYSTYSAPLEMGTFEIMS